MAATSLALKSTGTALTYGNATGEVRGRMDTLLARIDEAGQDVRALADLFPSQGPQITALVDAVLAQLMQGQKSLAEVKSQADEALGFLGTSHTEQLRNLLSDPMERLQAEEEAVKPKPTGWGPVQKRLSFYFWYKCRKHEPANASGATHRRTSKTLGTERLAGNYQDGSGVASKRNWSTV
jgi:hypothetical protein